MLVATLLVPTSHASVPCNLRFAPQEGSVSPVEHPYRDELCLNGLWQFQPVSVPAGYVRDQGTPPDLAPPVADRWAATPIKIPSPWNVNTWGGGRDVGAGSPHPYWPSSLMYPSYPPSWDGVEMAWMRRSFRVPAGWSGKRLAVHFESLAGECQVLVNGRPAGEHFDSYLPFDCDVTKQVRDGDNELLVGVRRRHLFNKTEPQWPRMRAPYPLGSNTDQLAGIWQDVSLVAVPVVHIADTFVKPFVSQDRLEVQVTVVNDSPTEQHVTLNGSVAPWINHAGKSTAEAPVPNGALGRTVLSLPPAEADLPAGASTTVTLQATVGSTLALWSPDTPNLNGLTLTMAEAGKPIDRQYTRFGWRELKIDGHALLLNGKRIQLFGDLVHPFGAFVMSRRYAWAWYRMVKDMHGNAVRLHAQPMPRFYLDMADEMGVLVLDETALFGSSLQLNFAEPAAWERFAQHYDDLVRRDRNHPSVFGWSFGNELFAIFDYNKVGQPQDDEWHAKLTELGLRARKLDPTREWISCDGDQDLRGTLPVWSRHLGHGLHLGDIPIDIAKPMMIGESGGTYYAKPPLLAPFNGDRAYTSYAGRAEALGIDAYQNVTRMAMALDDHLKPSGRPQLAFYSASETVWFGLEPLPFGYRPTTQLPSLSDGVVFTRPYMEGAWGYQPERLSPYVATLNPGWDASLPLYRPLAMFDAIKAALRPGGPAPWEPAPPLTLQSDGFAPQYTVRVGLVGPPDGDLARQLIRWGVTTTPVDATFLIIDGAHLAAGDVPKIKAQSNEILESGGMVLVVLGNDNTRTDVVNSFLPAPITRTDRDATMLVNGPGDPLSLPMAPLYFAENKTDNRILKRGLAGPFVTSGTTLLTAGNIDWTLFDNGENVKVGALALYEQLRKPSGAALVARQSGEGRLLVSAIDPTGTSPENARLWRAILGRLGVPLGPYTPDPPTTQPTGEHDLLRDGPGGK